MTELNNLSYKIQFATSNSSEWILRINNNSNSEYFRCIARSTENEVGYIYSIGYVYNEGNYEALITKTTLDGNIVWKQRLGGSGSDYFYSITVSLEGSDSYVYAVGYENSKRRDNALIAKFDSSGNLVWQRKLGGNNKRYFNGVAVSLEDSCVYVYAVGREVSRSGNSEALISKFDIYGNLVWQRKLGGINSDYFNGVAVSLEGSGTYVYAVGSERSSNGNNYESLIAKFNASGNLIWQRKLGGINSDYFNGVAVSLEGSDTYVYAVGYEYSSVSNNYVSLIAKFDSSGNLVWQRKLEGSKDYSFYRVTVSLENYSTYIYTVGFENSSNDNYEAIIVKFDTSGNLVWKRKPEGSGDDRFYGVTVSLEDSCTYVYAAGWRCSSTGNAETIIAKFNSARTIV